MLETRPKRPLRGNVARFSDGWLLFRFIDREIFGGLGRTVSRPRNMSSAIARERWTSSAVNGFIRQPSARSGIGKLGALPLTKRHVTSSSWSRTATGKPVVL